MIIVGFNGFSQSADFFARAHGRSGRDRHRLIGHDGSAAVVIDGQLRAALEEERLNRIKKTSDFPRMALNWCMQEIGLSLSDVDAFAFPWDFSDEIVNGWITDVANAPLTPAEKFVQLTNLSELHGSILSRQAILNDFAACTGYEIPPNKLFLVPHHVAHLMCGHALAGKPDAAFLISDGGAERTSSILGEVQDGRITIFEESTIPLKDSLGRLYSDVTRYLGFVPNCDEYKVMGLSAFGSTAERNPLLDRVVQLGPNGTYSIDNRSWLSGQVSYDAHLDELFEAGVGSRQEWDFQVRVARAVQTVVEVVTEHQVLALEARTKHRHLIFEGGVALNCVNNARLLRQTALEAIDVSFGASDVGLAIGAAFWADRELRVTSAVLSHGSPAAGPFLGPAFDSAAILAALSGASASVSWTEHSDGAIAAETAKLLADKVIVGWVQGAAEFGPRALGARSILANPSFHDIKDIINTRVKHREPFRPFAPMVLEEDADEVFEMGKRSESPYMTFVFPVREGFRNLIPGACHVDGTSRIQTVSQAKTPLVAALLREFKAATGVPCLLNTSFNVAGEPIVCTPDDAIACFLATEIDFLVLGNYVVVKK